MADPIEVSDIRPDNVGASVTHGKQGRKWPGSKPSIRQAQEHCAPELPPSPFRCDRNAVLMAMTGWSSARIARAFGVTQSAAWRYVARHRSRAVRKRRPAWTWRQCSACQSWRWFHQSAYRKRQLSRVFCSLECLYTRGKRSKPPL